MPTTTISSRELNQDIGRAKRAADKGPVIITDRGKPVYVLTTFDEFERTERKPMSGLEALAMPEEDGYEIDLPSRNYFPRDVDLD